MNTKIGKTENKITNATNLVTKTVLNTKLREVQNKIPYHAKYITTQEFNKVTAENFAARLKQGDLVSKADFDNKLNFDKRLISNKTKHLNVQKKWNSLITKDYSFSLVEFVLQVIMDLKKHLLTNQHFID